MSLVSSLKEKERNMGGMNHQPCGKYLGASTKLSRSISAAFAHLQLANVHLEDVILAELAAGRGNLGPIELELASSQRFLVEAVLNGRELRQLMDDFNHEELPSLYELDLSSLGRHLHQGGVIELFSWSEIQGMMLSTGFYSVLQKFFDQLAALQQCTSQLQDEISALQSASTVGDVHLVMEENRNGNIKESFARLYTGWIRFQQDFLASSILSTEVWYAYNERPSLTASKQEIRVSTR